MGPHLMIEIVGDERDALLLKILKRLEEARPHADAEAWERGWHEALKRFRAYPHEESLVPTFIRDEPVRWRGAFFSGDEFAYVRDIQSWIAGEFMECDRVYEFGCGTGFNLVALARRNRWQMFAGFDRSQHAVSLVREAAQALSLPITADYFDMVVPGPIPIPENTGVLTFGAMEQLGNFQPFIDYLLEQRPSKVVHVEPIPELLDPGHLIDWLSLSFHEKRGYTVGLLPYLENHPGIEVLQAERSYFGSLMLESYARLVWRPR